MARPLRVEYPGAFYHVFNRGIERRQIFRDQSDYRSFLHLWTTLHYQFRFLIHSYCLMPNHYHLFIETPQGNLSRLMQNLHGRYTQNFNRRYRRVGPLFQGRYKAILVDKESYALQISRYIHLNPVVAGVVAKPDGYRWSSYGAFLGRRRAEVFLETRWLLWQLAGAIPKGREAFHRFTVDGLGERWDPFKEARGGSLLGGESFVDWVREKFIIKRADRSISRLREIQKPGEIRDIEREIEGLGLDSKLKRKLVIFCLRKFTSLSLKEIGQRMGGMSDVAVCQVARRVEQDRKKDQRVFDITRRIEAQFCKM